MITWTIGNMIQFQNASCVQPRSGGPRLRETQVYPDKFGRRVAKLHLKSMAMVLGHESIIYNELSSL